MVSDQEITQVNLEQGKRAGISKVLHGMVGIVNPLCVFSSGVDIWQTKHKGRDNMVDS